MILLMHRNSWIAAAIVGLMAVRAAPGPPIQPRAEAKMVPGRVVGTPSCSARACHGGDDPLPGRTIGRHEYSAWNYADPHTRSYAVLFNGQSKKITTRLNLAKPAYQEPSCLACHAESASTDSSQNRENSAEAGDSSRSREISDAVLGLQLQNVGCESCHGAAWLWLEPHTGGEGWRAKSPEAAKTLLDVNNLTAVARSCVGCHIGAPAENGIGVRDMNHDMIAAGHPRLNFEFAGYLAQLPPHWNEKARPRDAAFYARAWSIGQAVSAEAALNLLEHRAHQPAWPELAEFACYACHHHLGSDPNWRQNEFRSDGSLPLGSWYFATLEALSPDAKDPILRLADLMKQPPSGPRVIEALKPVKPIVARVIQQAEKPPDAAALRERVEQSLKEPARRDWDGAAQLYLALAALSPDADRQKLAPLVELLRRPAEFRKSKEFDAKFRALTER